MSKAFASQADLEEKQVSFTKLSDNAYAYTAEGDPNTGVIVGDDDADHAASSRVRSIVSAVPSPGAEVTVSVPPS